MPADYSGLRPIGNPCVSKSNDPNFYTEEDMNKAFDIGYQWG